MRLQYVLVPALALWMAGSGQQPRDSAFQTTQEPDTIILLVDNDFGSTVNVFAVFGSAAARRVGSVRAGQEEQFNLRWVSGGFATQLESVVDNRRVVSNTLDAPPGAIVYVELDASFRPKITAFVVD